jgi:hypothetical protein
MFSRITSSLTPHHEPCFKVDFDQLSVRSASSVVSGVVHLPVDEHGGAGGTGRKAFEEVQVKFRAVQVSRKPALCEVLVEMSAGPGGLSLKGPNGVSSPLL